MLKTRLLTLWYRWSIYLSDLLEVQARCCTGYFPDGHSRLVHQAEIAIVSDVATPVQTLHRAAKYEQWMKPEKSVRYASVISRQTATDVQPNKGISAVFFFFLSFAKSSSENVTTFKPAYSCVLLLAAEMKYSLELAQFDGILVFHFFVEHFDRRQVHTLAVCPRQAMLLVNS